MKTYLRTIRDLIDNDDDSPLPIEVIPNYMGINLCSVEAISWTRQDDKQLVSLTVHFLPDPNPEPPDDFGAVEQPQVMHMGSAPPPGLLRRVIARAKRRLLLW